MAIVVQKNFPFCSHLANDRDLTTTLKADTVLAELEKEQREQFKQAESEEDALDEVLLSEAEIESIGTRLSELVLMKPLARLCKDLREEGKYYIYNDLADEEFIKAAWAQDAEGINRIIRVYAQGEKPRYKIDIPDPNLTSVPFYKDAMAKIIRPAIRENALESSTGGLIFSLPLNVALGYLDIHNRLEASDFEPMSDGINAKSYAAAKRTKWKKYPYTAIVVLGSGPQVEGERLSPKGRVRCAYVAELYRRGLAPFIILSGGRAHPAKTPFSEAEEMKRYLMENYGIPEDALIAEPHARHTTTNLRNSVRIMLSNGFPLDKPALITSTGEQLNYVQTEEFYNRCTQDMLVIPFKLGERIGNRELVFWPLPCASQINPLDPLDP